MTDFFLSTGIIFLGAIIGSFLNAIIYRLPRGISIITPARSFCPACQQTLSWWENIPLLSWLLLRGRCSACQQSIPFRYFLVEALTALLFWLSYVRLGFPLAFAGWIFMGLLIVASFIDLEHRIIPDSITLGGIAAGIGISFSLPEMMNTTSREMALLFSLGSAALGYLLLLAVLELGKIAFGRQKISWKEPHTVVLFKREERFFLSLEKEELPLEEILFRSSDKIILHAHSLILAGKKRSLPSLPITLNQIELTIGKEKWPLNETLPFESEITSLVLPREAMGLGDVKFLSCIGAFLGTKGMIISLFLGSIIGAVVASLLLLSTQGKAGRSVPFGPYLALGALIWFLKLKI